MAWPDTSLVTEIKLELNADLTASPAGYSFATDITSFTFDRDGNSSIVIRRGRQDEQSLTPPSTCELSVDNTDGRFSPRNPIGAYYGGLRRNTPLRVRVNPGSGLSTRYAGFVSELPPRWDAAEKDHYVRVRVDGLLRRLGQGASPLKSALRRGIPATNPTAWWPLEDGVPTSGLTGGATMTQTGQVQYQSETGQAGSDALPDFSGGGMLSAPLPTTATTNQWRFEFVARFGTGSDTIPDADFTVPVHIVSPAGSVNIWEVLISTGTAIAQWSDTSGGFTGLVDSAVAVDDGQWHHFRFEAAQSGANILVTFTVDGTTTVTSTIVTKTLDSTNSAIYVNPNQDVATFVGSVGHLTYWAPFSSGIDTAYIATGYNGELAHTRFSRLCTEESIPADVDPQSTELMGPQGIKTLLELLRECEAADEALMLDQTDGRLAFTPRVVRENRAVAFTLDYASRHISPPLEPTDDDQRIRNDVTVTRPGGVARANAVDTTGPVGVTAVGRYTDSVELNLFADAQTERHAGWRLNLGTVDGLRFPTVTVNLRRNNSLTASIVAITDMIGSRIKITNLPDVVSFDDVDLIIEGYTEQISQKNWIITFNCAPYAPYQVAIVEDPAAATDTPRIGSGTAVLATGINTSATSLSVTTGTGGLWTTAGADFSMDINIEGERIRLSAISGSSSPQTFTASARSVNGVVKSHLAGARIEPWQTATIGMA